MSAGMAGGVRHRSGGVPHIDRPEGSATPFRSARPRPDRGRRDARKWKALEDAMRLHLPRLPRLPLHLPTPSTSSSAFPAFTATMKSAMSSMAAPTWCASRTQTRAVAADRAGSGGSKSRWRHAGRGERGTPRGTLERWHRSHSPPRLPRRVPAWVPSFGPSRFRPTTGVEERTCRVEPDQTVGRDPSSSCQAGRAFPQASRRRRHGCRPLPARTTGRSVGNWSMQAC